MSLTLTRSGITLEESVPGQHTWVLSVVAESEEIPSEIFVYHWRGSDPIVGDIFECVASVHQLDEITLEPQDFGDGTSIPYYRSDTLTFNCRSPQEMEDLWVQIQADALDLLNNFRARESLDNQETVTFQ